MTVTVSDNDATGMKGITLTPNPLNVAEGSSDTYTVHLDAPPTRDVTIAVSTSHETEAMVSPDTLTFTTMNWNDPQSVTVSVEYVPVVETLLVVHNASGGGYGAFNPILTVNINDMGNPMPQPMPTGPGVTVSPTALTVTEEDTTGSSYTVVLNTLPSASVTVTVAGHSGTASTRLRPP